jgi:hypothetical protein
MTTSTARRRQVAGHNRTGDTMTLRRVRVAGSLLAVLATGLWFVVLSTPGASAAPTRQAVAGTSCPVGSSCATIPAQCPAGTTCPEVILTPTTDLGSDQAVFITAENFAANAPIYVYYCSDRHTLAQADPVCMIGATPEMPEPEVVLTASPEGTSSISFATEEDTDDGNGPLTGKVVGTQTVGSFYCDDYTNPCSIDITDPLLDSGGGFNFVLNPNNAVAVPISFAKPSTGCPAATFVDTSSEFGIDRIFPIASEFDCVGKAPAIAVNTAIDSLQAVTGMVGGANQLAFIDEPDAPDVQAELAQLDVGGKPSYALIPIGLSAEVIGFQATMSSIAGRLYPDNVFSLTPTMVAGLVTNYYSNPSDADIVKHCGIFGKKCSLLSALNTESGFRAPAQFGGYVRSDQSGDTSELFDWLCSAPIVPVDLDGTVVTENTKATAAKVLIAGLTAGGAATKSCPDTDYFPPLPDTTFWNEGPTPSDQALKVTGNIATFGYSQNHPVAAFAPLNWSWANYFGLLPAALQNADGNFVLPTEQSLYAAVASATVNANGTLTPDYTTTNPNAYPLPDIWYAVVPTTLQSAVNAVAYRTLLGDVLKVTGGSQSAELPPGFVPLPPSMYTAALADVSNDIHGAPATTSPPTSTTTTSTTTTTTPAVVATTTTSPVVTQTTSVNVPPTTSFKVPLTKSSKVTPSTAPKAPPTTRAFLTTAFAVRGHSDAWLAPAFLSVVALALLFGPGLLFKTRRRLPGAT